MNSTEISSVFHKFWKPHWGSVSVDELEFIQDLVRMHKPKRFLEVGMASGLSTGFIARFLHENAGEEMTSIDYDDTFFGDPTKPNGFLVPEIFKENSPRLTLAKFKTSLDIDDLEKTFEMAFIDANHQHPWPLIDTLCLWPSLIGPKIVIHHDLRLFRKQDVMFGIGPKFLFDQFPERMRYVSTARNGNIFALNLHMSRDALEDIAMDAMKLPWSLRTPLQDPIINAFCAILKKHYRPRLLSHFERCLMMNKAIS